MSDYDTTELLAATEAAVRMIRAHGLYASTIETVPSSPGSRRWDPETQDWTRPVLPKIELCMFSHPESLLAWAEHLQADRILVERRDLDTCLHFWQDHDGFTWNINSAVHRPDSGQHLPGITVDWIRQPSGRRGDEAWITRADLRVALTELGVAERAVVS